VVYDSHIFPPFQLRGKIIISKFFYSIIPVFSSFQTLGIKPMFLYFRTIIHNSLCFYIVRRLVGSLIDSPTDSLKQTQCRFSFQIHIQTAHINIPILRYKRLRWSRGSVLAFGTQLCGFKFLRAKKSSACLPSEGK
jgi:hypothetical protein